MSARHKNGASYDGTAVRNTLSPAIEPVRSGNCAAAEFPLPTTIIESKFVLVPGWVGQAPHWAAGSRIEAFNGFFVIHTVKQNQLVIGHHRPAKPMTNRLLPDDWRTVAGPAFGYILPCINAIASWTKELWPLGTSQFARHGGSHTNQEGQKGSGLHRESGGVGNHGLESGLKHPRSEEGSPHVEN
jgi:hypothetical protein